MLKSISKRVISIFEYILVVIFIVFEELIWERIAIPLFGYLSSLKVMQYIESAILKLNRYIILLIFVSLFIVVEGAGITAGILMVNDMVLTGFLLYAMKIPVAAFTFWLFKISEAKLLSFDWFKSIYYGIKSVVRWLKSTSIYKSVLLHIKWLKDHIKPYIYKIKNIVSNKESRVFVKLKRLYRLLKRKKS